MGLTYRNAGNTCTTLEERKDYAQIPPMHKGYVTEKVEYALRFPKVTTVRRKDGSTIQAFLQQIVVSGAIRADEFLANFYWYYKAEVSFDMSHILPRPFLSSGNKQEGPNRRHSLNPFPPGFVKGFLRRPDIILVENAQVRWPGLATTDHEGKSHADNLCRVVELKFPGDELYRDQRDDYIRIAGGSRDRLVIADVSDCDGDLKKAKDAVRQPTVQPVLSPKPERERAPIRSVKPIAEPAFYEQWLKQVKDEAGRLGKEVDSLVDEVQRGISQLSAEGQAWLRQKAPWLFEAGRWVQDAATGTWTWVNAKGQAAMRWTREKMMDAWKELQRQTDLAWEQLKQIDWGQLLINVVAGIAVVALVVAGVIVVVALSEVLVPALLALLAIGGAGTLAAA